MSRSLQPGDRVLVTHTRPRTGAPGRYDGRKGYVAVINRQRFPNGQTYVEIGVTWTRVADWPRAAAETWFRPDELERIG